MTNEFKRLTRPPVKPDPYSPNFGAQADVHAGFLHTHVEELEDAVDFINGALQAAHAGFTSISSTELTIDLVQKNLTVATGKGYVEGMPLKIVRKTGITNFIRANVVSYNDLTGALVVMPVSKSGAGTYSDWVVFFDIPDVPGQKLFQVARNSDVKLGKDDAGIFVSATSSYTQTFDPPIVLGSTWYCRLKNDGTGNITIPESDGRTNWIMYPGELRLFKCNGTIITSEVLTPFFATFVSSGSFIKAPGYRMFGGFLWGGGSGAGASRTSTATVNQHLFGGVGGACHPFTIASNSLSDTTAIVIGAGGVGGVAPSNSVASGASGGDSSFAGFTAFGGGFGLGGSGILSRGSSTAGGAPNGGNRTVYFNGVGETNFATTYLGGGASGSVMSSSTSTYTSYSSGSYFGSAGTTGCYGNGSQYTTPTPASDTVYGGGTGQSLAMGSVGNFLTLAKGSTTYGGTGGNASVGTGAQVGTAGGIRGGGGGAAWSIDNISAVGGTGGRGELQIWGCV